MGRTGKAMKHAGAVLFYTVVAVFAATALITLLGVAGVIDISKPYLDLLFGSLLAEVVAGVLSLFKATNWFRQPPAPERVQAIAGGWWQVQKKGGESAIAYVVFSFSDELQQLTLEGYAYSAEGIPFARFWDVAATMNATGELYYFWKGDQDGSEADFSGVGSFRFTKSTGAEQAPRGTGWYTTGNLEMSDITARRKVELYRPTEAERTAMDTQSGGAGNAEIVKAALGRLTGADSGGNPSEAPA